MTRSNEYRLAYSRAQVSFTKTRGGDLVSLLLNAATPL
jgi:hypothetical protein